MTDITWHTEQRRLGDLKEWAKNPRILSKHDAEHIGKSLEKFGVADPLIINLDGSLIGGHQRKRILGDAEMLVDVRIPSRQLTEREAEELAIRLNKNSGDWDWDMLANQFEEGDLLDWGFTDEELKGLDFGEEPPEDPGAQIDRAEELREKWGVDTGQLWQLGEHRLICGDCTKPDDIVRVMDGEKAQLTVTSPPYAVGKEYEEGVSFDEHLQLLRGFADRAIEITIPGGFIFTNFGEIAALSHASKLTGSDRQCIYLISRDYWQIFHEERGCDLYAMRIWYKPFNRLQQPFWSYHTSIPHHQEWEHIWTWRIPGGDGDRVCDWDISVHAIWDTRNEATDDKPLTRHVAAFPVGIPERAIKAHSIKGEIVYEPFSGSGTTLVACERLGRKCRAVEISPAYCAVAIQRWVDMTGGEPVLLDTLGARDEQS